MMDSKLQAITARRLASELGDICLSAFKADPDRYGSVRDFARDMTWHNPWDALEIEETKAERAHEGFRPNGVPKPRISHVDAARILLVGWVASGAKDKDGITATDVLTMKPTALKCSALGYVLRDVLPQGWIESAQRLDYARAKRPNGYN